MLKTIYLHIGPPKTGSTFIQAALDAAAPNLLQSGILYPTATRDWQGDSRLLRGPSSEIVLEPPLTSHLLLGYSLRGHVQGVEPETCWREVMEEIEESPAAEVILSAEVFANLPLDQVQFVRHFLKDHDVRIIAYLREPFVRSLSQYSQWIKTGRGYKSFGFFANARLNGMIDFYSKPFSAWQDVFGEERIILKDFDQISKGQGGLLGDFLRTVGAPDNVLQSQGTRKPERNQSPSPGALRILRLINLTERAIGKPAVLRRYFQFVRNKFVHLDSWLRSTALGSSKRVSELFSPLTRPVFRASDRDLIQTTVGKRHEALVTGPPKEGWMRSTERFQK